MKKLILISLIGLLAVAGCTKDELSGSDCYAGLGRIELSLSGEDQLFAYEGTKSSPATAPSLEDIDFVITGLTRGGVEVCEKILFKENGSTALAWFRAGTYIITATYTPDGAKDGNGSLCYSGQSQTFIVETAGTAHLVDGPAGPISILMTPSNARVKVIFDSSLKEFYGNVSVDFTSPREISVGYQNADSEGVCTIYLEAGRVGAYGITAVPLADSGAHKVEISGLYLPVIIPDAEPQLLEAGKEYIIRIKFAPGGMAVFLDSESTPVYTTEEIWDGLFS